MLPSSSLELFGLSFWDGAIKYICIIALAVMTDIVLSCVLFDKKKETVLASVLMPTNYLWIILVIISGGINDFANLGIGIAWALSGVS